MPTSRSHCFLDVTDGKCQQRGLDQILPTICCQCFLDVAIGNDNKRNSEDDKDDKDDTDDKDVKARQGAWAGGTGSR